MVLLSISSFFGKACVLGRLRRLGRPSRVGGTVRTIWSRSDDARPPAGQLPVAKPHQRKPARCGRVAPFVVTSRSPVPATPVPHVELHPFPNHERVFPCLKNTAKSRFVHLFKIVAAPPRLYPYPSSSGLTPTDPEFLFA